MAALHPCKILTPNINQQCDEASRNNQYIGVPPKVGFREREKMANYDYYDPRPNRKIKIPQSSVKTQTSKDKQTQGHLREANRRKGQV